MIENIKNLFAQVEYKTGFIEKAANEVGRKPQTLRAHWFSDSGFWSIPEASQPIILKMLQNQIKLQNEFKNI